MNTTVITREMATQFINIYHKTVHCHQAEHDYLLKNYTDEFYEGCMNNTPLFTQIRWVTEADAYPFVQTVYDAIHILMSPAYCLANNIKYCIDYVNIDSQVVKYLNAANLNYHVLNKIHSSHYYNIAVCYEDLTDATLEPNTCSICLYENNSKPAESQHLKKFYYSTAFSLNEPVCQECVIYDDVEEDAKAAKKDPDYKPFVFNQYNDDDENDDEDDDSESIDAVDAYSTTSTTASASEAGAGAEAEAGAYDLDAEVDAYEVDAYEVDAHEVASELDDAEILNENIVLTNTYRAMPYTYDTSDPSDNTSSMTHGEECYSLGWQGGWAAAMRYVEDQSSKAPAIPHCEYCGKEGKTKKCGGTCNGQVRYCSVECQTADWKQVHKYACLKNTF
jgi:hypothetical protein